MPNFSGSALLNFHVPSCRLCCCGYPSPAIHRTGVLHDVCDQASYLASGRCVDGTEPVGSQRKRAAGQHVILRHQRVGKGNGADLGGLAGARMHTVRRSPKPQGSSETNWRAYLSTTEPGEASLWAWRTLPATASEKDRGRMPGALLWQRAWRISTPDSITSTKQTALTENGDVVSGHGDAINMHDILTGYGPAGDSVLRPVQGHHLPGTG